MGKEKASFIFTQTAADRGVNRATMVHSLRSRPWLLIDRLNQLIVAIARTHLFTVCSYLIG